MSEETKWSFGRAVLGSTPTGEFKTFRLHDLGTRHLSLEWNMEGAADVQMKMDSECVYLTFTELDEETS
jgi:hypothetical protein